MKEPLNQRFFGKRNKLLEDVGVGLHILGDIYLIVLMLLSFAVFWKINILGVFFLSWYPLNLLSWVILTYLTLIEKSYVVKSTMILLIFGWILFILFGLIPLGVIHVT